MKKIYVVLTAVIVVFVIGGGVYLATHKPQEEWKEFHDEEHGLSFIYPANWVDTSLSTNDDQKIIFSKGLPYSRQYPNDTSDGMLVSYNPQTYHFEDEYLREQNWPVKDRYFLDKISFLGQDAYHARSYWDAKDNNYEYGGGYDIVFQRNGLDFTVSMDQNAKGLNDIKDLPEVYQKILDSFVSE